MINPPPIPQFLTPTEVAEILQVTTATIRNMIRRGDLPGVKLPGPRGIYRIPAHAIHAMLNENQTPIEARGVDGLASNL